MTVATGMATSVQYLKGVGPRSATKLERLYIRTVGDALLHLPVRYIDRRVIDRTGAVAEGAERSVVGEVISAAPGQLGRRRVFRAIIDDSTGPIEALWFHFNKKHMERHLAVGSCVLLTGTVSRYGRKRQFVHPDYEAVASKSHPEVAGRIVPVYPATEGVTQRFLRQMVERAWEAMGGPVAECLPHNIRERYALLSRHEALQQLHFPERDADIEALNTRASAAHRSLIFEEALLLELGLAMRRASLRERAGERIEWHQEYAQRFAEALPFEMTAAQCAVLDDIAADLRSGTPMHRLVQGDVGSGKTAVAGAALAQVVLGGGQAVVMAPTELLASQHAKSMRPWMQALGVPMALLTGSTPAAERALLFDQLVSGELPLLIGTHAVLEEHVDFQQLKLVVIDEQHRFGVQQRLRLRTKGTEPHVLVLTATPIPRSLAMAYYGDLDVSVIDQLPPGRKPVVTKHYREAQRARMHAGIQMELQRGHQVYVVCPLVDESEHLDVSTVHEVAAQLKQAFGEAATIAILHGKMAAEDKHDIMQAFVRGEVHILVSTTVIEVGVDVPNATVMIVEHAERFGLAQLHQLRGRVGRGADQAYCVLMTPHGMSDEAKQRISTMVETTDGFRIAEVDLAMRGPGEFLGTKQSGLADLQVVDLVRDAAVLEEARTAAWELIAEDAQLAAWPALRGAVLQRWGSKLHLGSVG